MVTFNHWFVRFDHKREYSTRLTKQKFNRGTIEAFNKKKERFLVLFHCCLFTPFEEFASYRVNEIAVVNSTIPCHQHLESKPLFTSHPIFKSKHKKWKYVTSWKKLKSNLVHTTRLWTDALPFYTARSPNINI
jgi:hypothetical protein